MKNKPLYDVRPIKNLRDMLNSSAGIYGEKAAFLSKEKEGGTYQPISYNKYKGDVDAFGTALLQLGLQGKRIAVIGENQYPWSVTYLSVVNGVGIIVPLDRELPSHEIQGLLDRARVSAVVFARSVADKILPLKEKLEFIDYFIMMDGTPADEPKLLSFTDLLKKGHDGLLSGDKSYLDVAIDEEAMSILLFTSGTTDMAKAVMLSHRNICSNLEGMSSMLYIDPSDIFLSVLPIHHTYECTCGFLCPIYRGATVAYFEGLRHIPKNLQEAKATVMLGVPLIYEAIFKRIWDQAAKSGAAEKLKKGIKISNLLKKIGIDLTRKLFAPVHESFGGHLRLFISGAAGIDPKIAAGLRDLGISLVQGYGLTECSPIAALNRDVDYKDDAAGLPLPNLQLVIEHPNEEGVGEIAIKGPSVMMGYYQNPEAMEKVLKDGWFYSGDLGFQDSDGFIHITGRKKNVIITKNGKNIYPEEIETILNRSPFIKESLVVSKDDSKGDDILVSAIIVPDEDAIAAHYKGVQPTAEEIHGLIQTEIKAVNKELVIYKHVRDFTLRETEFIKTTTKKIKRHLEQS